MVVAIEAASRSAPGARRRRTVPMVVIVVAAMLLVGLIGVDGWIRANPPVSHGSAVAVLGEGGSNCDPTEFTDDASLTCYEVPFAAGAGVGIGFTIRNTAPIPMTVVAIKTMEPPFLTPAYLHPELTADGFLYGLEAGRPFEPTEVPANGELPIQLVGTYQDCETVARDYVSGGALIVDHARMTLRWGFVETDVDVPLGAALSLPAPDHCP